MAYKDKEDKLWTGLCSGNWEFHGDSTDEKRVAEYRKLVVMHSGSIFGKVVSSKPVLPADNVADVDSMRAGEIRNGPPVAVAGMIVHANGERYSAETKTAPDGAYEFSGLPNGKYTIVAEKGNALDVYPGYKPQAEVGNGVCARIDFDLQPVTRIRGHVSAPESKDNSILVVEAIPTTLKKVDQFSGKYQYIDSKKGLFDLWPLPPGDYYVGVNIGRLADSQMPFLPTYYPGVTDKAAATIVHITEGEVKELELPINDLAKPRTVHVVTTGLGGKLIHIQLEDLRNPGNAAVEEPVLLDPNGVGTLTIYSGYSYHLHTWGEDSARWCSNTVVIPDGTGPVEARIEIDHHADGCEISEIDGLKK
jgi:hypothetical protein